MSLYKIQFGLRLIIIVGTNGLNIDIHKTLLWVLWGVEGFIKLIDYNFGVEGFNPKKKQKQQIR